MSSTTAPAIKIINLTEPRQTPEMSVAYTTVESPVGDLLLVGFQKDESLVLTGLYMDGQRHGIGVGDLWCRDNDLFGGLSEQLGEYFAGTRRTFDVTIAAAGTDFQLRVWRQLAVIEYGETITYGELAARVEVPGASRAVGTANGHNPVAIVVPCHRVVAAGGGLGGYGGGLARKRQLLDLEGASATLKM